MRLILVILTALIGWAPAALGGQYSAYVDDLQQLYSHQREAEGYLRTGNIDLAALALDEMQIRLSPFTNGRWATPPEPFASNPTYQPALAKTGAVLSQALKLIDVGDAEAARQLLLELRNEWIGVHRASGLFTLGDCLAQAGTTMDALMAFRKRPPDWDHYVEPSRILGMGAVLDHQLAQCDTLANVSVRGNPEFRRLIDMSQAALALLPPTIANRNHGRLIRILIELRSLERLLQFKFG